MRRLPLLALPLLLAACATGSGPSAIPPAGSGSPAASQRGALIGLGAAELTERFGQPRLRLREGPGVKLQFASADCVLDTYLYPPAGGGAGTERVTHVDARRRTGEDLAAAQCIASFSAR